MSIKLSNKEHSVVTHVERDIELEQVKELWT
jgi:hypothetical protein